MQFTKLTQFERARKNQNGTILFRTIDTQTFFVAFFMFVWVNYNEQELELENYFGSFYKKNNKS
jgi:hypothetical protein